jgi:predicted nucleotidyltransferase
VGRAIAEVDPASIYLFGSRVRGDFAETSDLDIGFKLDEHSKQWPYFVAEENERASTLLSLDLVNFSDAHEKLRDYIQSQGVLIYERSTEV